MRNGTNASFGQLQQIDAGLLNVGYTEAGKSDGPMVMLLHGWPYDIYSFVDVAPRLSQAGYRVIVPYVRGYAHCLTKIFLCPLQASLFLQCCFGLSFWAVASLISYQAGEASGIR